MNLYKELLNINLIPDKNNYVKVDDAIYNIIKSLYNKPYNMLRVINTNLFLEEMSLRTIINCEEKKVDYKKSLENSKIFINSFFKFHDVNYLRKGFIIDKGSPFSIEIKKDADFGYLVCQTNIYEDNTKEIIFSELVLPNYNTILLPLIYAHELTHSQLYSVNKSVDNIFYDEVLPIFMEYLYIFETNSLNITQIHNYYRLGDLLEYARDIQNYNKNNIIDENIKLSTKYFISTIIAYKLFDIYINSNSRMRKELIN